MGYGVVLSTIGGQDYNFNLDTPKAVQELVSNSLGVTGVQIWDDEGNELSDPEVLQLLFPRETE